MLYILAEVQYRMLLEFMGNIPRWCEDPEDKFANMQSQDIDTALYWYSMNLYSTLSQLLAYKNDQKADFPVWRL